MNQYLLVHIFRTLLAIALGIYVIQSKVVRFGLWLPNIYVYVSLLIILWISIKGLTKKNATIDLKKSRLLGALALLVFVVCCSSHVYLRSKIRRINEQISIIASIGTLPPLYRDNCEQNQKNKINAKCQKHHLKQELARSRKDRLIIDITISI